MSSNYFKLKTHCVVLATDMVHNKKYILSTISDDISLPFLLLDNNHINNINASLIEYLKEYIPYANDIELMPQLITLHSTYIQSENDSVNIIYGFLVDYQDKLKDFYWIEFNDFQPHQYSNIIFEVIQKLY